MAKVAKVRVKAPASNKEAELRRWAIEAAMRWPTLSIGGYGQSPYGQAGLGGLPRHEQDVDLIGRAKKILDFIRA